MVDYSVDSTFDLHFTGNGDFAIVEGREEFEEDFVIELDSEFGNLLTTTTGNKAVREKIHLIAVRTAKKYDVVDRLQEIQITEPVDKPYTIEIELLYDTGETFQETL
jgi:hypothetical protein